MVFKNFDELIEKVQVSPCKKRVAVVSAHDEHTLEAVFRAKNDGIISPVLIGDRVKIKKILDQLQESIDDGSIIDVQDDNMGAKKAVRFVHDKKADFIMKGKIQTADLLRAIVDKNEGLRTGNIMSHVVLHQLPTYHKLLAMTDGGMMMYPSLEEKKQIIGNAVNTLVNMGYEKPKVAVLAAVEKVNPKMPETVDANELKKMNEDGIIKNCLIEGPISYDLAMNKKSAEIKGFESVITGDVDILVVPNITAGNILGKCLIYSVEAKMAGFVVGAKVPVVLTSRGSSSEEKYLSLVLSAAAAK